jgi:MFS family permease
MGTTPAFQPAAHRGSWRTVAVPGREWLRVAGVLFAVGWGANQFSAMILAYRQHQGLSTATTEIVFGIYALGLIPALLVGGPVADRLGRRRVAWPAAATSVVATVVLVLGAHSVGLLYVGRFLAGVASGAMFAAGTAWVKELSAAPYDPDGTEQSGARRAAIALSLGFGLGPVVAGLLAQWAPHPLMLPYVPHLLVMVASLVLLAGAPETVGRRSGREQPAQRRRSRARFADLVQPRFVRVVVPFAPWVFAAPAIAFAFLPGAIGDHPHGATVAFASAVAGATAVIGVLVQPVGRPLNAKTDGRGAAAGLSLVVAGLLVGVLATATQSPFFVLVAALLLGGAYGLCLVSGLLEVQRIAHPDDLASLTAVYYAFTYLGFAAPIVLAELAPVASHQALLAGTAVLAALTLLVVVVQARRHPLAPRTS